MVIEVRDVPTDMVIVSKYQHGVPGFTETQKLKVDAKYSEAQLNELVVRGIAKIEGTVLIRSIEDGFEFHAENSAEITQVRRERVKEIHSQI